MRPVRADSAAASMTRRVAMASVLASSGAAPSSRQSWKWSRAGVNARTPVVQGDPLGGLRGGEGVGAVLVGMGRLLDVQGAAGAGQVSAAHRGGVEGAEQGGHHAVRELQQQPQVAVDAAPVFLPHGGDPGRLGAGRPARHGDHVAADVHQRPAAQFRLPADVAGAQRRAHAHVDVAQIADCAGVEQAAQAQCLRVVAEHHRLHQQHPAAGDGIHHALRRRRTGGERLLAEHVLAAFGGADRPLLVHGVGQRQVHRVDAVAPQQVVVAGERLGESPGRRQTPPPGRGRGWPRRPTRRARWRAPLARTPSARSGRC